MKAKLREYILSLSAIDKHFMFLDSNHMPAACNYQKYDWIAAWGAKALYEGDSFDDLYRFQQEEKRWLFGYFTYDLKNTIEKLESNNFDGTGVEGMLFFEPRHLIYSMGNEIFYQEVKVDAADLYTHLYSEYGEIIQVKQEQKPLNIQARIDKNMYLRNFEKLRQHIIDGDIYEINYCMEFYAEHAAIDPLQVWEKLNASSPTPYAVYMKNRDV